MNAALDETPEAPWYPKPLSLDEVIEEVTWLLGTDSPEHIARRLRTTMPALARRLQRAGRHDLAVHFGRVVDNPYEEEW